MKKIKIPILLNLNESNPLQGIRKANWLLTGNFKMVLGWNQNFEFKPKSICMNQKKKRRWLVQIEAKMMHGLNHKEHTFTWLTIAQLERSHHSLPYLVYSMIGNNDYNEMTKILDISKWESCFNFYLFCDVMSLLHFWVL
jgi:hypothetical protein